MPEDRKHQGLILEMAIRENFGLLNLRRTQRSGFLNFRDDERAISRGAIKSLNVKAAHDGHSGANFIGRQSAKSGCRQMAGNVAARFFVR